MCRYDQFMRFHEKRLFNVYNISYVHMGALVAFQRHQEIHDLFEDFRDGVKLLTLLEVLTSQILVSYYNNPSQPAFQELFSFSQ